MSEALDHLIKKGSYFYRPNKAGYTSFKFNAGRYTKADAEAEASVEPWHMKALHQDSVPDDTAPDRHVSELKAEIAAKDAEIGRLRKENEKLLAFSRSFKLTCVEESFYKDCYLHIIEPDSVSFRLGNGSQFSKFIKDLDDRRAALSKQEGPDAPGKLTGYCTDCENTVTVVNGRCGCGSGRVAIGGSDAR